MTFLGEPVITWIKVQKPSFDLEGVLVSSLTATLLVASVALVLGCLTGVFTILYHRKTPARSLADDGLHLLDRASSARP